MQPRPRRRRSGPALPGVHGPTLRHRANGRAQLGCHPAGIQLPSHSRARKPRAWLPAGCRPLSRWQRWRRRRHCVGERNREHVLALQWSWRRARRVGRGGAGRARRPRAPPPEPCTSRLQSVAQTHKSGGTPPLTHKEVVARAHSAPKVGAAAVASDNDVAPALVDAARARVEVGALRGCPPRRAAAHAPCDAARRRRHAREAGVKELGRAVELALAGECKVEKFERATGQRGEPQRLARGAAVAGSGGPGCAGRTWVGDTRAGWPAPVRPRTRGYVARRRAGCRGRNAQVAWVRPSVGGQGRAKQRRGRWAACDRWNRLSARTATTCLGIRRTAAGAPGPRHPRARRRECRGARSVRKGCWLGTPW